MPRQRLIDRFDAGVPGSVFLISAPGGYGKTTLTAAWLRQLAVPACWYSIEEGDNNPADFFGCLVSALQTHHPMLGEELTQALDGPQPPQINELMLDLVNELSLIEDEFILVLDDLHRIRNSAVDSALSFLVDHLPVSMRLVITTRREPALPLSRLRAKGLLTEIRFSDLCFSDDEAALFLERVMRLDLSESSVCNLNARTEGWIAGLQMAALSLIGRDHPETFVDLFSGDHRFVVDYLVEEVLSRQPEEVREFLLKTSILEYMTAPLCDAVTGRSDSREMLTQLERNNMLLFPLDERREWYRYHRLFADHLRSHAPDEAPEELSDRHLRASRWLDRMGYRVQAIEHALKAESFDWTADLVERTWPEMDYGVRPMQWLSWAEQIPPGIVEQRPVLSAACAWMLLDKGELETAARHLHNVERHLDADSIGIVSNTAEFQVLPGSTMAARAYASLIAGEYRATAEQSLRSLGMLPAEEHFWRGTAALFLGLARWYSGDLEQAYESISEAVYHQRRAGNQFYEVFGVVMCADIRISQGRLSQAYDEYRSILGDAKPEGHNGLVQDPVALYTGLGELFRCRGDLGLAEEYLDRGFVIRSRAH